MGERLSEEDIISALRDVDENDGHMEAPGSDEEILARWEALKGAGYVRVIAKQYRLTPAGRAALASHRQENEGHG